MQTRFSAHATLSFIALTIGVGCKKSSGSDAGQERAAVVSVPTEAEARALVSGFLKGEEAQAELTKKLLPTYDQCKSAFTPEEAAATICEPWKDAARAPNARLSPGATQTEVIVSSATTEELRTWTGKAQEFHGGYKRIAAHLRPGLRVFRFTFVEPGSKTGLAVDTLFFVDGKWFLVMKPWRRLGRERREPSAQ